VSDTADLFSTIASHAVAIDTRSIPGPQTHHGVAAVRALVIDTHDRLPGSAGASDTGIRAPRMERCADRACTEGDFWDDETQTWAHSHPIPNDPAGDAAMRPSTSEAMLTRLDKAEAKFVANIAELVTRSVSRGVPDTWDEAVSDCSMLDQMDAIAALEAAWGVKAVRKWVTNAGDALEDIDWIWNRYVTRDPNDHERTWTSGLADEECCRVCLQLRLRVERHRKHLCSGCYQLHLDAAEALDLHPDYAPDPPPELIAELRRSTPSGPGWKRTRQHWIAGLDRPAWLAKLERQMGAA
jgi:hypothetical protein